MLAETDEHAVDVDDRHSDGVGDSVELADPHADADDEPLELVDINGLPLDPAEALALEPPLTDELTLADALSDGEGDGLGENDSAAVELADPQPDVDALASADADAELPALADPQEDAETDELAE